MRGRDLEHADRISDCWYGDHGGETMEEVKTIINIGGYTISSAPWSELYEVSVVLDPPYVIKRKVYDDEFNVINKTTIYLTRKCLFYIESDDLNKLHKFTGVKYEGLVDRPKDVMQVIEEFAKKFEGCTVLYHEGNGGCAIYGKKSLHTIRQKGLLFIPMATTDGLDWKVSLVCRITGVKSNQCNDSYIHQHASEIIAEFTRIMKDEDRA